MRLKPIHPQLWGGYQRRLVDDAKAEVEDTDIQDFEAGPASAEAVLEQSMRDGASFQTQKILGGNQVNPFGLRLTVGVLFH